MSFDVAAGSGHLEHDVPCRRRRRRRQSKAMAPNSKCWALIRWRECEKGKAFCQSDYREFFLSDCADDECVNACKHGWKEHNGHCYYLSASNNTKNWTAAEDFCREQGSHLRWQKMDMTQFGSEETTLRRTLRGSGPTALLGTQHFGLQPSQTTLSTKTVSLLLDYPGDNNDWRYNRK